MSAICFVMQPFDNGQYDRRFNEVYAKAITAAGFVPYRVDLDFSASIPIERIQKAIRECAACFADISEDNPNVWFELGYSIAAEKELCIVCSEARTKFPFDVQHRQIIKYRTASPSEFADLEANITNRLQAIKSKQEAIAELPGQVLNVSDMPDHLNEVAVSALGVIAASNIDDGANMTIWEYETEMSRLGFTQIAAAVATRTLERRNFLMKGSSQGGNFESYTTLGLTSTGWNWVEMNLHRYETQKKSKRVHPVRNEMDGATDDEIPF